MHEVMLVEKFIESAEEEAKRAGLRKIKNIKVKVGSMNAVSIDQFKHLFDGCKRSSSLEEARLEVETVPVQLECGACNHTFIDSRFDDLSFAHLVSHFPSEYAPPPCPECGATGAKVISGDEFKLVGMEGE